MACLNRPSLLFCRTSATSVNGTKPTQLITLTKRDGRLSQHKSMQKFGMHPTEMVSKLKTDGIVTDMEARIILLLVESDNNEVIHAYTSHNTFKTKSSFKNRREPILLEELTF